MAQLEFSVPYNGDAATLRQLIALQRRNGNVIREIYLNAPQAITGSGRVGSVTTLDEFVGVVSIIREAGIRVDVTMNSTCDGGDWTPRRPSIAKSDSFATCTSNTASRQ